MDTHPARDITEVIGAAQKLKTKNDMLHAAYEKLSLVKEELRKNFEDLTLNQQALKESEERYRAAVRKHSGED